MQPKRWLVPMILVVLNLAIIGCSRDPNVKKQQYLDSGKRFMESQKYREAAIQFSNALQVDNKFVEAHYQLAQAYGKMGQWSNAYRELSRTVELDPNHSKAQLDLGNLLLAGHDLVRAEQHAQAVISKDPNNADAHALLANIDAAKGNQTDAMAEMQKAIQIDPKRSQFYLNSGMLSTNAKDFPTAEANFKKAEELDPKSVAAMTALARFYEGNQRFAEAEQEYRKAIQTSPKLPAPYAELARFYMGQKQPDRAEQTLRDAKSAMPDKSDAYRLLGELYIARGERDKALAEFDSLHREHPKDLRTEKAYIELLIEANRGDEAVKLADEVLKADPKDSDATIAKARVALAQSKPADAIALLTPVIKRQADNALAHYNLGIAYAASGKADNAETEWREAVRARPDYVEAHQRLAERAVLTGNLEQLEVSGEQLIKTHPTLPLGYIYRARADLGRKPPETKDAEENLNLAIQRAPRNPEGYIVLGDLRITQGKYAEGEKLLDQALTLQPNSAEALQGLVASAERQHQLGKITARLTDQIQKSPDNSAAYLLLGRVCIEDKKLDKAEEALQKGFDQSKGMSIDLARALAAVQLQRGASDRAIATYEKVLQVNPNAAGTRVLLASAEEAAGAKDKAEADYKKVLQLQPQNALAANNLAFMMLERGTDTDTALALAQTARRGLPDIPGTADTLAWAYYAKGSYANAIELLEDAIKKEPNNPSYHYHLGMAYEKLNDAAKAKVHLQRTLQLDPKFAHADDVRKALGELGAKS